MKKNMYSLMLNEEVVRAVDELAAQKGTNRSALINEILAEHMSMVTPQKRVANIIDDVFRLMSSTNLLVAAERTNVFSVKSALPYRYRPTLRYQVEILHSADPRFGILTLSFRSTARDLIKSLTAFVEMWTELEEKYIAPLLRDGALKYGIDDGVFSRTLSHPRDRIYDSEEIAAAISEYVRIFDVCVKNFLAGRYTSIEELEPDFLSFERKYVI